MQERAIDALQGAHMRLFHTVVLPLATVFALYISAKKKAPIWKYGALIAGCCAMISGLWLEGELSTILLVSGGVLFFLGVPRGLTIRQAAPSVLPVLSNVPTEQGVGRLRILFEKPEFFLTDVRVVLLLDGVTVYEGGFKAGIDVTAPTALGQHRLESIIELGLAKRRRAWAIAVPPSGCDFRLEYSRLWGNFAK